MKHQEVVNIIESQFGVAKILAIPFSTEKIWIKLYETF